MCRIATRPVIRRQSHGGKGGHCGGALGGLLLALGGYPALGTGLPLCALATALLVWRLHGLGTTLDAAGVPAGSGRRVRSIPPADSGCSQNALRRERERNEAMVLPISRAMGCLLLLALLVVPTPVLAAPALTITPSETAPGGTVVVSGSGLTANTTLSIAVQAGGQQVAVLASEVRVAADGTFRMTARVPALAPPGTYDVVAISSADQTELARGKVTVTNAPSVAPEQVSIAPTSGPAGTRFVLTGRGFAAGASLIYGIVVNRQPVVLGQVQVGADGSVTASFDSSGIPPGQYQLFVATGAGIPPLAGTTFTVTAGSMPGLPSTGGGGIAPRTGLPQVLMAGFGIVLLVVLAAGFARRRSGV